MPRLGEPGIGWTSGDYAATATSPYQAQPQRLLGAQQAGRAFTGYSREAAASGDPQAGRRAGTGSDKLHRCAHAGQGRCAPSAIQGLPRTQAGEACALSLFSRRQAPTEWEGRPIGGLVRRFRRLGGGERRRGSKGLLASRWVRRPGTRREQERVPRQQLDSPQAVQVIGLSDWWQARNPNRDRPYRDHALDRDEL